LSLSASVDLETWFVETLCLGAGFLLLTDQLFEFLSITKYNKTDKANKMLQSFLQVIFVLTSKIT